MKSKTTKEEFADKLYDSIVEVINQAHQEGYEKAVEELKAIEDNNYDKMSDTLDFDGFAEDVVVWLHRNKK